METAATYAVELRHSHSEAPVHKFHARRGNQNSHIEEQTTQ